MYLGRQPRRGTLDRHRFPRLAEYDCGRKASQDQPRQRTQAQQVLNPSIPHQITPAVHADLARV